MRRLTRREVLRAGALAAGAALAGWPWERGLAQRARYDGPFFDAHLHLTEASGVTPA